MNKKERAEFEAAIVRAALHWTAPVPPDLPVPASSDPDTSGWYANLRAHRVERAWSAPYTHGTGAPSRQAMNRCSGSQGGVALHSKRSLALQAVRHAVEVEAAKKLRELDSEIMLAKAAECGPGGVVDAEFREVDGS